MTVSTEARNSIIHLLGIQIHDFAAQDVIDFIAKTIQLDKAAIVANVNVHCMNLACKQPWLIDFLNKAEVNFCDGAGVMLGARILGYRIPERITYADWTWQLAEFAEPRGFTFYFLGAKPGIAEKAAAKLKERHPNLQVIGTHHGYFDKTAGSVENEAVIQQINALKPNILVLGFGMPLQEKWLMENWDNIEANIALTGGAVFDYISGELQRGPKWMTDNGFEWLARLIIEPRRLWKRYLIGNPLFLYRVLKQRFTQK